MSKKHFQAIADVIADLKFRGLDEPTRWIIADRLAAAFAGFNGRFQRGRFMEACGVPSGYKYEDGVCITTK